MGYFKAPKLTRESLGLTKYVRYDEYDPNSATSDKERKSLAGLDYSPLKRVTWESFWMGILVSMGGLIFGFDTGQISGFLAMPDFLDRFGQRRDDGTAYFSHVRSGLIVSLLSIGTLIGALIAAPIADAIGRRLSVTFWCIIFCVGNIVMISADHHWYQVMMGRWVAGLSIGGLSLLVPMYMSETAPRHIRGALISTYQLFITLGIFIAACINYGTNEHQRDNSGSWRIPMGVGFGWAIILGTGILLFPDTPRYLYRKGRKEEAKQIMLKVYGAPPNHYSVHMELEEIEAKFRAESAQQGAIREWINMFSAPKMAYRILLGMLLQMFQQLTGANYFFYYGTVIFESTGIKNSFVTQMILNGINFGTTFYGLYVVEHYGRRKSLIFGSLWMFLMFMIFASVGHFSLDINTPENTESSGTAMIVIAALFITGFATTWGPIIWTLCGELYPSRYRAKAMALSTASNWLWNFLIAFFTPFITDDIDFLYGYVFAGCNLVACMLVYFFVIEGSGRTLEEIDTMYILGVKPWKSASWIAPPPEEITKIRRQAGTHEDVEEAGEAAARSSDGTEAEKETQHRE
ncbi:hexose transporter hxt5 [Exophiala dermatitidis]|uniref:MFS transporter, SP family, sugar:H+ symporter n=2 Tax=Exophiala dermatitidis TaxID=5970 RepID=H6BQS2_EXODN|nr:MFS transporter, SP family, sugar:H+ symporter [Exophiala dermatitidis NIH/UT8656]KAJ4511696.1 hexose transporter hxt5 [Exophiala dermatitidis]EHY54611.1 MFS transporter, SP family, sugar:H+ symporter [Exophiala dermatitidis NIH/UT8656]KAJ4517766.1 hexose transporter hxt5 [Exophiala dermatitidis]KAJ4521429.1 hexose transporter hxt5 [Exophiala dermatitidis]KAJ4542103.1 hexose transporter hxt5 [Exophiala dermatitidis]